MESTSINPAPSCGVLNGSTSGKCSINPAGRLSLTIYPALFYSARVHPRSRAAGYSGRCWIKDPNGIGKWILILGCPLKEKHFLTDHIERVSGPTFADCASCEFQQGRDFEFRDPTGELPIVVHPHLLKCGCPYSPQD